MFEGPIRRALRKGVFREAGEEEEIPLTRKTAIYLDNVEAVEIGMIKPNKYGLRIYTYDGEVYCYIVTTPTIMEWKLTYHDVADLQYVFVYGKVQQYPRIESLDRNHPLVVKKLKDLTEISISIAH